MCGDRYVRAFIEITVITGIEAMFCYFSATHLQRFDEFAKEFYCQINRLQKEEDKLIPMLNNTCNSTIILKYSLEDLSESFKQILYLQAIFGLLLVAAGVAAIIHLCCRHPRLQGWVSTLEPSATFHPIAECCQVTIHLWLLFDALWIGALIYTIGILCRLLFYYYAVFLSVVAIIPFAIFVDVAYHHYWKTPEAAGLPASARPRRGLGAA